MSAVDTAQSRKLEAVSLLDMLRPLYQRLPVILAAIAVLGGGALLYSLLTPQQYTATAKLLFRDPGFDQKLFGSTVLAPSQDPAREAATNVALVELDTISIRAAGALEGRLTPAQIRDKVEVLAQGQSNVVVVMATDRSKAFAAQLANTIAGQYIAFRRDADRSKINQAASLVRGRLQELNAEERGGAAGRSLRSQIEELGLLASLQTGNAELVQPAMPPRSASSPKPLRNTLIGLFAGLVLGSGLALALDRVDRRMRHGGDAEAILERPILGVIPESRSLGSGKEALVLLGQESDAFRALRTNLRYFAIDREIRSLLITSSAPGDGKSTVARYLATTAAAANDRTVLLEADLRRGSLTGSLADREGRGLSDVLAGKAALADVIQKHPLLRGGLSLTGRTLDVVTSGPVPPNPTDLLESERMGSIVAELERLYDLVIIDTSPITVVPDAIPIMTRVSGVLVVIRERKSTRTGVRHLRKQLDNLGISPLGIVINGAKRSQETGYGGYYGYGPTDSIALSPGAATAGLRRSRWPWRRGAGEGQQAADGSRR